LSSSFTPSPQNTPNQEIFHPHQTAYRSPQHQVQSTQILSEVQKSVNFDFYFKEDFEARFRKLINDMNSVLKFRILFNKLNFNAIGLIRRYGFISIDRKSQVEMKQYSHGLDKERDEVKYI
jgi:hypothetical protein